MGNSVNSNFVSRDREQIVESLKKDVNFLKK